MLLALHQNMLLGGDQPPVFVGPSIANLNLALNVAMSPRNFAPRFVEYSGQAMTFTLTGTPPNGVTLSSAGVLSGTPTQAGVFGPLKIVAEDEDTLTQDSNEFYITVSASTGGGDPMGSGNVGTGNIGGPDLGGPDIDDPFWWYS